MQNKNKQIIKVYDAIAEKYAEVFDEKGFSDKPFLDKFLKHLKKGRRILDLGCGSGRPAKYLFDKRMVVEGIDLSSKMIKIAKSKYPKISFKKVDMRKMKYGKNSFDGIWAGYSLFHINKKDFLSVMKKIRQISKPNGIFGLVMQEGKGEVEMKEPLLPKEKTYLWLYSTKELKDILKKNQFKILDYSFEEPKLKGEFPYRKLLFVAKIIK